MAMTAVTVAISGTPSACLPAAAGAPLLAFADHRVQVRRRTDLERTRAHTGVLRHELDGVLEIARFEYQDSPQLLLGLREGTVDGRYLAVAKAQGDRGARRLQGLASGEMAVAAQLLVVSEAAVDEGVPLALGHRFELACFDVA